MNAAESRRFDYEFWLNIKTKRPTHANLKNSPSRFATIFRQKFSCTFIVKVHGSSLSILCPCLLLFRLHLFLLFFFLFPLLLLVLITPSFKYYKEDIKDFFFFVFFTLIQFRAIRCCYYFCSVFDDDQRSSVNLSRKETRDFCKILIIT